MKSLTRKSLIWIGAILLVIFAVLLNTIFAQLGHGLWTIVRHAWLNILLFALALGFGTYAVRRSDVIHKFESRSTYSRRTSYGYGRETKPEPTPELKTGISPFAGWSLAALAIVLCFLIMPFQSYLGAKGMLNSTEVTTETDAAELSFNERVPYDVAQAVSDRSLGDTSGNSTGSVKSIPETGEYTTSVIRRGMFQGYESVQTMKLPEYGAANTNSAVKFCKYDENAKLRIGGMGLNNNLTMKVYMKTSPSTKLDPEDAVAICVADGKDSAGKDIYTPMLYAPLTRLEGFFSPHRVPAGVAVYNGRTGELKIEENIENSPVAVYPVSIAKEQRESLAAEDQFTDYLFKRAGFDDTSKDGDDPNKGNNTEFAMKSSDSDDTVFVTPLTPRGSSSSIVGLSTIDSNTVKSGTLNPMMIHRYEEGTTRDANSTIAATIISTTLEGYKANGLSVFEVVPSTDGTWTASIGKDQSILYRAHIAADGHTVTLVDASGRETVGNLGESASEGDTEIPAGESPELTGKPLDQMTPDELKNLADQITSELAERASASQG